MPYLVLTTPSGATPQAATPTFAPAPGTYTSTQSVALACSTPSSTIYYTTDGSTPTTSSAVYTTPIVVSSTTTIKAIATAIGYLQSALATGTFTISLSSYKWNPGYFYANYHIYSTPFSDVSGDLTQLQSAPLPPNQIPYYAFGMAWGDIETSSAGTNANSSSQYSISRISAIINAAQAQFPVTGCRVGIYLSFVQGAPSTANIPSQQFNQDNHYAPVWVINGNAAPGSDPTTMTVPTQFGSGSTETGPIAPIIAGSNYYNLIFANYDGTNYGYVMPDWRNPIVVQAMVQMIEWLGNFATFTITSGPFANGVNGNPATWTLDTCPCVEFFGSNDEVSWNFNQGPYKPRTDNGTPVPTYENIMSGYATVINAMQANLPHTLPVMCSSYGVTGSNGQSAGQDIASMVNPNIPVSSGPITPFALQVAMSGADTYGNDWNATTSYANQSKQAQLGIGPPGVNTWIEGNALPPVTVTSMVHNRPYLAQIQPKDQASHIPSGITHFSQAGMASLMQSATVPHASHMVICSGDSNNGATGWTQRSAWSGSTTPPSYIQAALLANYLTYPLDPTLPSAL